MEFISKTYTTKVHDPNSRLSAAAAKRQTSLAY
jgi:hypothetical protein